MPLLIAFFFYFLTLIVIALLSHKKMKDSSTFIVGGRSVNFYLTALSAHASDMSAWLFMAYPAALYVGGMPQIWTGLGLFIGMWLNWQFVAYPLRTLTEQYQANTLATYLECRFDDKSGLLRLLSALMLLVFISFYLCAGLIAMGVIAEALFNLSYSTGICFAALAVMGYTFYGGFVTVAWTDLFQALFLLAMLIIVPTVAFLHLPNGIDTILASAAQQGLSLNPLGEMTPHAAAQLVILAASWGLGYFGQPHIITKFMGIDTPADLRRAKWVGMCWQALALLTAAAVGIVAIGVFPSPLQNPELVYVELVKSYFAPFFAGIVLCAILAANISTMDSQLLVCGSLIGEDLFCKLIPYPFSSSQRLLVSRLAVIFVMLIALAVAWGRSSTVLDTVLYAWTGLGCAFGPLLLISLYDAKASRTGAIAAIITGGTVAAIWDMCYPFCLSFPMPAMLPGFALSTLSCLLFSRLFPQKKD